MKTLWQRHRDKLKVTELNGEARNRATHSRNLICVRAVTANQWGEGRPLNKIVISIHKNIA